MSNPYPDYKRNTITLPVAEQLAQQEPVAWAKQTDKKLRIALNMGDFEGWRPLVYADTSPPAQRTWVGLTDEEFKQIMLNTYNIDLNVSGHSSDDHLLWNAIEAKLKEKNHG